jgi:hypothetical protein
MARIQMLHEADDGPAFARRVSLLEDNDEPLLTSST